jgi:hypothetical protein
VRLRLLRSVPTKAFLDFLFAKLPRLAHICLKVAGEGEQVVSDFRTSRAGIATSTRLFLGHGGPPITGQVICHSGSSMPDSGLKVGPTGTDRDQQLISEVPFFKPAPIPRGDG